FLMNLQKTIGIITIPILKYNRSQFIILDEKPAFIFPAPLTATARSSRGIDIALNKRECSILYILY
uniref:hypothetical protein n=1 Tax=Acinetobacter baumannii TaxID=470 RepID=UPI001C078815